MVLTAKTESCLSSSVLVQAGQIGVRSARVKFSDGATAAGSTRTKGMMYGFPACAPPS